ncbi:MAG: Mov34/MPN/PAD-1 family protein [Candidatus Korarchaeota archaeon]
MKVFISPYALARMLLTSQIQNETAGVVVGYDEDDNIYVTDAIWARIVGSPAYVSVPANIVASIAESIDTLGTKEYIVGWYHTHPGFGHFMSYTDIQTQLKFQELYEKIVAIIVDPKKENPLEMAKVYQVVPPREVVELEAEVKTPDNIADALKKIGVQVSEDKLVEFFIGILPKTSI